MNRKELLKALGLGTLALSLPRALYSLNPGIKPANSSRAIRFAHITDIHMQPEKNAPDGLTKCLHHLQALKDKPDFIVSGGDTIMDALVKEKPRVEAQWDLWHSLIKNECSLPIEYCIGNHDVWGLEAARSEPLYGKKYALEMMKLAKPYRSFDRKGWHFVILDSTHITKEDKWYTGKLDEAQMDWLKADLAAVNSITPVIIISHIPIVSAAAAHFGGMLKEDKWVVPASLMHGDSDELVALFHKYPNVKLCLSGHLHLSEQVQYNNVTYICNGAVSGAWWGGDFHETKAGYAIIDLYNDGTFRREYVPYA